MLELLGTYSLTQIVTFIVLLAIAVKEGITLVIWFKDLFKKKFNDNIISIEPLFLYHFKWLPLFNTGNPFLAACF